MVDAVGLAHVHRSGRVGFQALDMAVEAGERVAFMGPNGSGKTTLLRVLSTALRPTAGRLRLLGDPVPPATPELRRRLGVAGDRPVHLDALTGRENLRLFGCASGLSGTDAEARGAALFERFGLTPDADVPVAAWSLGMRRKLLLACAAVHDPELVLLDEPTLGLDPPSIDALLALVAERTSRGRTAAVVASNDPGFVERVADRVLFLDRGRVVLEGTPAGLLEAHGSGAACTVEVRRPDGVPGDGEPEGPRALPQRVGERLPKRAGIELRSTARGIEARLAGGATDLPALVEAIGAAGLEIRSLDLRAPTLADIFRAETGTSLDPGRPRARRPPDDTPPLGPDQDGPARPSRGPR